MGFMDEMSSRVLLAKDNESELEVLIQENKTFILSVASSTMKHFVTDSDDEWSVALIAFAEAVQGYSESKGDFRAFAGMVIKRRLIDYIRSESRHGVELTVEPYGMDADVGSDEEASAMQLEVRKKTAELARKEDEAGKIRDEIAHLSQELREYGIGFFELEEASPRAAKTKEACSRAVSSLMQNDELAVYMKRKKSLPMKELAKASGVDRKTLERHRKYIIAVVLIKMNDLPQLAEYVGGI